MVTKLYRAVEIKEDDIPTIRKVKEKISFEMKNRTKPESFSLLCSALNPFAKDLTFLSQEDRDTALKLLRDILIPLNVTLNVKKKKRILVNQMREPSPYHKRKMNLDFPPSPHW